MDRRALLAAACMLLAGLPGCGKRGDPRPPLRRTPQPVSALALAERGDSLRVTYTAPRSASDGSRLGVLEVEILRADGSGDFAKTAARTARKAAPGEALSEEWPLPPAGTIVRVAARARAGGRASVVTGIVTLKVQPPPEPPSGLAAHSADGGVGLSWTPPEHMPVEPSPPPLPSPTPGPSAAPAASPSPPSGTGESPSPAPPGGELPAPAAGESQPAATPAPTPTPTPTPPPPTTGFWVYRRAADGAYERPLQAIPLQAPSYLDALAHPGERWCYQVRTVAATDPAVESTPSEEACLEVVDVTAPRAPAGVAVLAKPGAAEVSWSPSPEPDLAAYRVYRASGGGAGALLAEVPAGQTRFTDTSAQPGVLYRYTVTAVDTAGNESPPSSAAAASLP